MEKNYVNFPIAGCLKHGIQENNRPKELGYFITKVQEDAMKHLQQKFDKQYNKQKEIIIYLFSDDTYSIKRVKRNQSGTVCYCLENSKKAKEKINKKWCEKDCLENCESKQSNGKQPPMCQEEITLKFLMPNISKDRIWIFQSRSYHSINNIVSYINLQKQLGNSIQGFYKLFLSQKVSEKDGKKFTNYVVDIVKLEESDLQNNLLNNNNNITNCESLPTDNKQNTLKEEAIIHESELTNKTINKSNSQKNKTKNQPKNTPQTCTDNTLSIPANIDADFDKYYVLLETGTVKLSNKGKEITYTSGKFINNKDQEVEILLHPDFANEIKQCELGSQFILDTQEVSGKIFAMSCKAICKQLKEAV